MATGYGHSGVAGGDGKRKRSEGRSRGVCGLGSGDGQEYPGDPPTTHSPAGATEHSGFSGLSDATKEIQFLGVRARVIVEVKRWDGPKRDFNMDVKTLQGMEALTDGEQKQVAAIVHDLARLYGNIWNPEHLARIKLNIGRVELLIRKQDLADERLIGGDLLDNYVRNHKVERVNAVAGSDEFKALKRAIAELALPFLKELKAAIAEELFRAGCQRQDEAQFFPSMEGVEHMEDLEIQHLKDQIASLKAELEAKDAELMGKLKAKEAESRGKDIRIASLEEALRTVECGYLIPTWLPTSPTSGLLPGATGAGAGVSSGCKLTPLYGLVSSIGWSLLSCLSMKQHCGLSRLPQDSEMI